MLKAAVRRIWKLLPSPARGRLVRITQSRFTVSAAAAIVNDSGEVLLLNHVLRPYASWGLPGGFIDAGEQPEEAIRREVIEGVGLGLNGLRLISVRVVRSHVEMVFMAKPVGEAQVSSREISDIGWFNVANLPDELSRAQRQLIGEVLGKAV
jgi:ADP-ribose pyrophosphatase YjhB (NUDIX family)